ncbi:MAG: TetR/AcrR family transcriptional repressor of nem operon [Flavobacteriales bacterium]
MNVSPPRDPEATRQQILTVAAEEIWLKGFQNASLSVILERAGVSKGALYHHFKNKQELGYSVFDEVFTQQYLSKWQFDYADSDDPISELQQKFLCKTDEISECDLKKGCPVTNISLEMTGVDEGFRQKSIDMYQLVTDRIEKAISDACLRGFARNDIDPAAVALFLSATIQGMTAQAKYIQSVDLFKSSLEEIARYLETLRA